MGDVKAGLVATLVVGVLVVEVARAVLSRVFALRHQNLLDVVTATAIRDGQETIKGWI